MRSDDPLAGTSKSNIENQVGQTIFLSCLQLRSDPTVRLLPAIAMLVPLSPPAVRGTFQHGKHKISRSEAIVTRDLASLVEAGGHFYRIF